MIRLMITTPDTLDIEAASQNLLRQYFLQEMQLDFGGNYEKHNTN